MKKILVVDDMEINRDILEGILEDEYDVITAANGAEAIEVLDSRGGAIAVTLLDLTMPVVDGFGVLDWMISKDLLKRVPVIIITGENSNDREEKCFGYGVSDFIRKPFDERVVLLRVKNVIDLFSYKNALEDKVRTQNDELIKQYARLKQQAEYLEKSNQKIIDILGTVVESRNLESGQHIQRVKTYTNILAYCVMEDFPEYGLTQHKIDVMTLASALHDIGKIAIPDSILLKPARLTADEFECMKTHTTKGCIILQNITDAWDEEYSQVSYDICRYHHERFNGKGYPDGLVGDDIPIAAQIVSIADVYDALVNDRVYKDAFSHEQAFNMIVNGECGVFSPKLLECFKKSRREFEELVDDV